MSRLFGLLVALAAAAPLEAQTVAIIGGRVHPVGAPVIEDGTVVLRDGRIVAVGRGVAVPPDAQRIDARGKWVTPGLFHGYSTLGTTLFNTGSVEKVRENVKSGDVTASFRVAEGIDPAMVTIPVARLEGLTTTVTVPEGGLIPGQAALIDLAGDRLDDMLVHPGIAMVAVLTEESKAAGGGSRAGALQRLRELFRDAREYARRRPDFRTGRIQPLAAPMAELEALLPVLDGRQPLAISANRRSDIESALRLQREFGFRLILVGALEGWTVARELAASGVPVGVAPLADVPSFDAPRARLDNAALLRAAGVPVFIVQSDVAHYRDLRQAAGNAVRSGMSWDDALAAITSVPAAAYGVTASYGTLQPGRVANVVVWSGDPFELSTQAEHVFIRGREMPPTSRQTELREKYRTLTR
jgi:imidazolonepropionase-like amidohydrolase